MYYGNQPLSEIERMTEWRRQYAYDAVRAIIAAERRAAEEARKEAERDAKFGTDGD